MFKWLHTLIISMAVSSLSLNAYERIEEASGLTIESPTLAQTKIRKLRLDNGLEVILQSDPTTPKSGAVLAVNCGSWDDPQERPGMAHFIEHMLFLGTEKYPDEGGYHRYLNEHGGIHNAFTMADRTVYLFSIDNNAFDGALDRFGQFFISPLFHPSGIERERHAIHQEFCKDIPVDGWRMLYVKKQLANPEHPFSHFCIGNLDTLSTATNKELKDWYQKHYSSHLMRLFIYSAKDLDTLENEVSALFSQVEKRNFNPKPYAVPLFSQQLHGKLISIVPVQDLQLLEMTWELPRDLSSDQSIKAEQLLTHVLGDEGETSLFAQLKKENLAEGVQVSCHRAGGDQFLLSLTVNLTKDGVKQYSEVIKRCFEGIESFKKYGIPKYIFDELVQVETTQYRFQSRQDLFNLLAGYGMHLHDEPISTFPRQTLAPISFSEQTVSKMLKALSPETCIFTLVAPPELSKIKPNQKEKWMGIEFSTLNLPANTLKHWANVASHPKIAVPRPNHFLPDHLNILETVANPSLLPQPQHLYSGKRGEVYFYTDDRFGLPEVSYTFNIKTPEIKNSSIKSQALADLYCAVIQENLNTVAYEAAQGGLSYRLNAHDNEIFLSVKGYSDKAPLFLTQILEHMKHPFSSTQQISTLKSKLQRDYYNELHSSSLKEGKEALNQLLYQNYIGTEAKLAALSNVSYQEFQNFSKKVFERNYIEAVFYGAVKEEEGKKLWDSISTFFPSGEYPKNEHNVQKAAMFSDFTTPPFIHLKTEHPSYGLILTLDCGSYSFKMRAAQEILSKALEEPFFTELRTKQQTGYIVGNWTQTIKKHLYSHFAVQSSTHSPEDLLNRFEFFLESTLRDIKDRVVTEEKFESIKQSFIAKLQHPADNLSSMGEVLHQVAFDHDADFQLFEKRIKGFEDLTYNEFLSIAKELLGKENKKRIAIGVSGPIENSISFNYQSKQGIKSIKKELDYN